MGSCIGKMQPQHPPVSAQSASADFAAAPRSSKFLLNEFQPELKAVVARHLDPASKKSLRQMNKSLQQAVNSQVKKVKVGMYDEERDLTSVLTHFPNLEEIVLYNGCEFAHRGLEKVSALPAAILDKILDLDLSCTLDDDDQLRSLRSFSALKTLDLRYNDGITDAVWLHLKDLKQLRTVDLRECKRTTAPVLHTLPDVPER